MGTKLVTSPVYEHTCDMCGEQARNDTGPWARRRASMPEPPNTWTVVPLPAARGETAMYRVDEDANRLPMIHMLLCWGCLGRVGEFIRKGMAK